MVNVRWEIIFDGIAKMHLKEAYEYIRDNSPQSAVKVLARITTSISNLAKEPDKNPPDKFRLNNDGSYRAYEIDRYRITYKVSPPQILILEYVIPAENGFIIKQLQHLEHKQLCLFFLIEIIISYQYQCTMPIG